MLMPKRVKYRKQFRGRMKGKSNSGNKIAHGQYGLVALEPAWITNRQIEAARIAMTRYIRRGGQVWIKIFPDKPVTAKPAETRMGSGKGSPEYWVAVLIKKKFLLRFFQFSVCKNLISLFSNYISIKIFYRKPRQKAILQGFFLIH